MKNVKKVQTDKDFKKSSILCLSVTVLPFYLNLCQNITKTSTYMRIKAIVSQQSNEVDDLIDVLVIVGFICDKHSSCIQEQ